MHVVFQIERGTPVVPALLGRMERQEVRAARRDVRMEIDDLLASMRENARCIAIYQDRINKAEERGETDSASVRLVDDLSRRSREMFQQVKDLESQLSSI